MKYILLILILTSATCSFASEKNLKKFFKEGAIRKKDNLTHANYEFYANKKNVFYVWASWCPACKSNAPDFLAQVSKLQKCMNIGVSMINVGTDQDAAEKAIKDWGYRDFTIYREDKEIVRKSIQGGIPKVIITDDQGEILEVKVAGHEIYYALEKVRKEAADNKDCRN